VEGKMREIKFRAWDQLNKKVYPVTQIVMIGFGKLDGVQIDDGGFRWLNGTDIELMQYTGLKDKNGKEIYEGDIVINYGEWNQEYRTVVTYSEGYFTPLVNVEEGHNAIDSYWSNSYEVIGNIYENPELLK
jgi:uncharacterized phage protein (TIGR01671 family)